jgi:hypothetical protein
MASYCREKYERTDGQEKVVCWKQNKHVHDGALIVAIEQFLNGQFGGVWTVRANSYQSEQSSCGPKDVEYTG